MALFPTSGLVHANKPVPDGTWEKIGMLLNTGSFYNPMNPDFGAVGDGTTNDGPALQACIDAAQAAGNGAWIWIPPKVFLSNQTLTVTDPSVRILGAGWDQVDATAGSVIKAGVGVTTLLDAQATANGFQMHSMALDGAARPTTAVLNVACDNAQLAHCGIRGPGTSGTCVNVPGSSIWMSMCRINGAAQTGATAIAISGTDATIIGCKPLNAVTGILLSTGSSGAIIEGCHITPGTIGVNALWLSGNASNVHFVGNRVDNSSGGSPIQLDPTSTPGAWQINSNIFTSITQTDNTWAVVGGDTTGGWIKELQVQDNVANCQTANRWKYFLAAQTRAGGVPGSNLALFNTYTTQVMGNRAWAATSFLGPSIAPWASDNVHTLDNTAFKRSKAGGAATFSGTGAQTVFTIAHGLYAAPSMLAVTPATAAAAGSLYVTADATNVTVTYTTAPVTGTNNVVVNWRAEV